MMKRFVFTALLLLSLSGLSYAADINATFPCETGNIVVTGTFDPLTTAFTLFFAFNDCAEGDEIANGSVTSNGTINVATGAMNITSQTALSISNSGTDNNITLNCTQNIAGTYNFATETINGSVTNSCVGQGSARISLLNLFLEVFP